MGEEFKLNGIMSVLINGEEIELGEVSNTEFTPIITDSEDFKHSFECEVTAEVEGTITEMNEWVNLPHDYKVEFNQIRGYELKQIRTHSRKRINKKWAKKYGYIEVPVVCKMSADMIGGEIDSSGSLSCELRNLREV